MANIQERRDKNGKLLSFSIRVFRGRGLDGKQLKPWTTTFDVSPTWKEDSARKKAEAFAAQFEAKCKSGEASDNRQTFAAYADYVIQLKEERDSLKHSTAVRYRELAKRIYPAIGHIKLKDLRVDQLNDLYTALGKKGEKKVSCRCTAKIDLESVIKKEKISRSKIAKEKNMASSTVCAAIAGKPISKKSAEKIADALGLKLEKAFNCFEEKASLSSKTVIEHHRFIHTVLQQAVKERIIPYNPASLAELPKVIKKKAQYYQPEEVEAIREALEKEPLKWKVLTHLFLITGARRGEILGLKWSEVDFENSKIHICNNVLYSPDRGIYEDTLKTSSSDRYIILPRETMRLLSEYKLSQQREITSLGEYYQDRDFVFAQYNGGAMHPDSVTDWMAKFSERHGLPHIHPHAFRHTMASILYFKHADSISISKRLGHAKVSTTTDMYSHIIAEADKNNAEILEDFFRKKA